MITLKEVEKLALLCRIELTEEEKQRFTGEIDSILGYITDIQKITGTITEKPLPEHRNVLREDSNPHAAGQFTEAVLSQAPKREGDYIRVKRILNQG